MAMKTIVVPVDFSDVTNAMIEKAVEMARAFSCSLTLIHVVEPEPDFVDYTPGPEVMREMVAEDLRQERHRLHELAAQLRATGLDVVGRVRRGPAVDRILEVVEEVKPDLLVMGSHGHGALYDLLVGSVAEHVLRKVTCPVVVVPSRYAERRAGPEEKP
jgi:nucleotide-binding universal stress UspA family protein